MALLFALFALAGLLVYAPALEGPFVSDDQHYLEENVYVHELSPESVWAILQPHGPVSRLVENYAPVHVLLHGVAWQAFGNEVLGHHVLNVAMHAAVAALLVSLFLRWGMPRAPAVLCGLLFLLHPANVEAVAWISQLKTSSSLLLALLALHAHPARPALGAGLFGLALLAKPIAAFALPVAGLRAWLGAKGGAAPAPGPDPAAEARRWPWLAGWAALLAAFAAVELRIFEAHSGSVETAYPSPWVHVATAVAIVARYLVMAVSSWGVGPFHEPPAVTTPFDPWLAAAVAFLALAGARAVWALRQRRLEAVFWLWAAAAYAPVSQVFPFPFPMADRYLYFVLPGLLGAAWCLVSAGAARFEGLRRHVAAAGLRPAAVGAALVALLALTFAVQSHEQAGLWSSEARLMRTAARNNPDGTSAALLRARREARRGDAAAAVSTLRPLAERGYNRFDVLLTDPAYRPIRSDPRFHALVRRMARWWTERMGARERLTQPDLHMLALARELLGDREGAVRALERALEVGGPYDPRLRRELRALRKRPPEARSES